MTDPYATADTSADVPTRSRRGPLVALVALLAVAVAVGGLLLFRRGDALSFEPVSGWSRIARDGDASAGEKEVARSLDLSEIPGFERARVEVWSTPEGPAVRSAVLTVVDLKSADDARRAHDAAVAASAGKRERFETPEGYTGFRLDRRELIGEGHRVLFTRGDRLYVVSVTSPRGDDSPAEALRIAERQAA